MAKTSFFVESEEVESYISGFEDAFGTYESMEIMISPEWNSISLEFDESGIYLKTKLNFDILNPFERTQMVAIV
jgi:hypothetical protein